MKGHAGHEGNEGADGLANQGCLLAEEPERDWQSLEGEVWDRIQESQIQHKVVAPDILQVHAETLHVKSTSLS